MANIDDFKANLIGGGARANQFRVTITPPPGIAIGLDVRRASFLVSASQIPASTLGEIAVPFRGRNIYVSGDRPAPDTWTTTALHKTKLLDMRINGTATWKDNRFAKGNTNVGNLTETQCEMLWGPLQITEKIQSRLRFIGKKHNEFASTDLNVFGTFETNSDRAFKCRKETTAGRIDQVGMEIVDVMQKDWRKKGIPASIGK